MLARPKTLEEVIANRHCSGCGACAALAPTYVAMRETEDENRRPAFKSKAPKALQKELAHICPSMRHTPVYRQTHMEQAWGPVLQVWQGHAIDPDIRFKGSSGGGVTALALSAMRVSGMAAVLHVKARSDDPALNEAALSYTKADLLRGAGSRYAPASVADRMPLLSTVDGECVVIGKPCDIAGANAVAAHHDNIAHHLGLTISIFCAGTPSNSGTKALLTALGMPQGAKLKSLHYRGNGWPGDMVAAWQGPDGTHDHGATSYADGWGNILQKYRQWRCHTCADHTGELADISVGDPWQDPPEDNALGQSLFVIRSERGRQIFQAAIESGHIQAYRVAPQILFEAQPNLYATKGAVWGRRLVHGLIAGKALRLRGDSFDCWQALSLKAKTQSVLGTLKRVLVRRFFRPVKSKWLPEQQKPDAV